MSLIKKILVALQMFKIFIGSFMLYECINDWNFFL